MVFPLRGCCVQTDPGAESGGRLLLFCHRFHSLLCHWSRTRVVGLVSERGRVDLSVVTIGLLLWRGSAACRWVLAALCWF